LKDKVGRVATQAVAKTLGDNASKTLEKGVKDGVGAVGNLVGGIISTAAKGTASALSGNDTFSVSLKPEKKEAVPTEGWDDDLDDDLIGSDGDVVVDDDRFAKGDSRIGTTASSDSSLTKSVTFEDGRSKFGVGMEEKDADEYGDFESELTDEQRLLLEQENEQLLAQFESGLDQIRYMINTFFLLLHNVLLNIMAWHS
jgi:hypothetical protein